VRREPYEDGVSMPAEKEECCAVLSLFRATAKVMRDRVQQCFYSARKCAVAMSARGEAQRASAREARDERASARHAAALHARRRARAMAL